MTRRSASTTHALPTPAERLADDDGEEAPAMPNLERLVADAMALAANTGGDGAGLAELVNQFWRLVPDEDLVGRTAAQMLAAVTAHLDLAAQRLPGELKLEVEHGADRTALLMVTDDMPFLVDSVTAAVTTAGLEVELLAHPQVVLRREALGALRELRPHMDPDDAGPGDLVESWMRLEVAAVDEASISRLTNDLRRVLTDVREAVEDWPAMRRQALTIADELASAVLPVPEKDISDSVALLRWLAVDTTSMPASRPTVSFSDSGGESSGNFTFLGYREYRIRRDLVGASTPDATIEGTGQATPVEAGPPELMLEAVLGTGLGILRGDPTASSASSTTPEVFARLMERRLLTITKANSRSTVHRSAYLDYIGLKIFDADGNVVGERRFLGLFSSTAYRTSVKDLPVVRRKVAEVIARAGLSERGHSGKQLLAILEDYPRDELFQAATDDIFRTVMGVLRLAGRRQVRVFARPDQYGRFVSCLVYLPRDRFTTANRMRIQEILLRRLHGAGLDYTTRVTDDPLARIHVTVRTEPGARLAEIDTDALSAEVAEATKSWDDELAHTLDHKLGAEHARRLLDRYRAALPETYKDSHTTFEAMQDLAKLELIDAPGELVVHLFRRRKNDNDVRFKVFWSGPEPITLSDILPVLQSLGVRVEDERPYEIALPDIPVHLYDFGLRLPSGDWDVPSVRSLVENAFTAAWRHESEVDGFNQLVLLAGLTWREAMVLRAYAKYLRQAGAIFSQDYMETTLAAHPAAAALLVELFHARFDPTFTGDREARAAELTAKVRSHLDQVASLDQDRILRAFLTLINATLRTSYFQRGSGAPDHPTGRDDDDPALLRPKPYVAFKFDAQSIPDLPAPRPRFEIFVYSPRFEGVHLRFGPVARGGLRWSDRREDFRTEILGLVKAQTVKNAVIVPTGAKGGFVLKQPPAAGPSPDARAALQAEGMACYRQFIAALLDVTDNIVGGTVVPPSDVVRRDGDDPYLVVAADKGTAAFSDIANDVSRGYGFWLGDAFASGGSAGYDHKKMGITARGVWESIKRHVRELNLDPSTVELTTVGIGDMSGDVFGNGMLYSDRIRLVAAFDHRHIFIDPTPDAASSMVERRRLFALPGSSWADYDTSLISAGGGVFPRTAKSLTVTPEMRQALGIADDTVTSLAPNALIQAILRAPVDLLFNGGIGTYVKSTSESHADVGDKSNDGVRVDGAQVRARIIGEGGNLGLTQQGRIEYALQGGFTDADGVRHAHISTDFIDNSAGVDCSDHEVNIKILLGAAVADGTMSLAERDALLADMTDEVAALVLRDNYDQAKALAAARTQAASLLPVHQRMIADLEREGHLDRALEGLPDDATLQARFANGAGLASPELAILLAYTKINATKEIHASTLPDDSWTEAVLVDYFPTPLRDIEGFVGRLAEHPLRRELVTTVIVNEIVNRCGLSFLYRAQEETDASIADIARAYVVVRDVYDLRGFWRAIEEVDDSTPAAAQTALLLEVRRLVDRAVRWLVANRTAIDVTAEIERFRPGVAAMLADLPELMQGREREALLATITTHTEAGLPTEVAAWGARIMYGFGLLDIVEVALATDREVADVASVYFVLSERFRADEVLSRISALPRRNQWQTMARMALRYDLYAALAELTAKVLATTDDAASGAQRVQAWEGMNEATVARVDRPLAELSDSTADLASLSVLLRQIRTLVRARS